MRRSLFVVGQLALLAALVVGSPGCGSDSDPAAPSGQTSLLKTCVVDCATVAAPACQTSQCNVTTGQCELVPLEGDACDDGLFCTVHDTCHGGRCVGDANTCGLQALACKTTVCEESTHACSFAAQADGFFCGSKDVCSVGGTCESGVCVSEVKTCHFETPPDDCHALACNPATGACDVAIPANEGGSCYSNPCLVRATCHDGKCQGDPRDCSPWADDCNTASCDAAHKGCFRTPKAAGAVCFGKDTCNSGACAADGHCVATPRNENKACKDALTCTTGDACHAGRCRGTGGPTVYLEETFAGNAQGWTNEGPWAIGPVTPVTGDPYASCKPDADHTGGVDNGIATTGIGGRDGETTHALQYLTSPSIDTSAATTLVLTFSAMAGLPAPPFAQGVAEVWNGTAWVKVWDNPGGTAACLDPDTGVNLWTTVKLDVAAHKSAGMRVRFGTAYALASPTAGLSIDDVSLLSAACP